MKTPLIVFRPKKLKENYLELENICKRYLRNFKIAYSIKTNSSKEVIKLLSSLGSGFEVASLNEIRLVKNNFIVFNSPAKTSEELKLAIKNNFLINADSISEIEKISKITKNKSLKIGLRISIHASKFGISPEKIKETIDYAKSKNLQIFCLQLHQGTKLNLPEYEQGIKEFSEIIAKENLNLKYLDIGGGIPDKTQLKNLNLKLENYLEIISKNLSKFNSTIILEPGRALVSDAFYLLTKVIAIKENFEKNYAILDAGINILPKITLANYKFSKIKNTKIKEKSKEYLLAGPLLFSNDILGKFQGNLQEGDLIKVENIGAYCYNLAWEISYKKPQTLIIK